MVREEREGALLLLPLFFPSNLTGPFPPSSRFAETAKSTLTKVLDDVSSALSSLFGRSVKTPTDPPSSLRPLLLVDPRTTTEASDVEALREHLCEAQEREKDELEGAVFIFRLFLALKGGSDRRRLSSQSL